VEDCIATGVRKRQSASGLKTMSILTKTSGTLSPTVSLPEKSLVDLVSAIVRNNDNFALHELHRRRLFRHRGRRLTMTEFILALRDSPSGQRLSEGCCEAAELAYDLSVDKFLALPSRRRGVPGGSRPGPDCTLYYGPVLKETCRRFRTIPAEDGLRRESVAANCLQGFVVRTFGLSCRDALRRIRRTVRRYVWTPNGQSLTLWVPSDVPGRRISAFLVANFPSERLAEPDAQDQAQALVNAAFRRRSVIALEAISVGGHPETPSDSALDGLFAVDDLAATVADEKADGIQNLRPSIMHLGRRRLRKMIKAIFTRLADGEYSAIAMAREYDLSKAAMSRWAGLRWSDCDKGEESQDNIPDLWRNVAGVLAGDVRFVQAVRTLLASRRPFLRALDAWEKGRERQ